MASEVLPATEPMVPPVLSPEDSADAAAEVQVPGSDAVKQPEQPEPPVLRGIYFVRVPRPVLNEGTEIQKLETELSACFTKLKAINNKFQVKKGEANELRKQLTLARSLRNGSSPEFDEKMTRLKQLRTMRKEFLDKIAEHRTGRAGLECRTEEELEEKIAEMEHSIQHDGLTLNAEKQMVKQISKLKGQREKIREFQGAQEGLGQMEEEARKLKAVIDEIDGEVNILRGERDQAKDIIDDLSKKLTAVNAIIDEYQAERQDIEGTKKEVQDQLKVLREENDEAMLEFRANRKLGVELRDLVAEGKVEEAQKRAEEQVESYLSKLNSDKAYKQEYIKLWSEQRRYAVSELLPQSGNVEGAPAAAGKGPAGRGAAPKSSVPLVPQGKAKAEALIAAALQEAGASLAAQRLAEPQQQQQPEPEEEEEQAQEEADSKPEPPARRVVPGATDDLIAVRKTKAPKVATKHITELPVLPNYEYELPVDTTSKGAAEQLSAEELKAQVREEQRQKAAEAEERKKRRQEQQVKKALQRQRAAEEAAAAAAKAAKAANRAAALAAAAAADVDTSGTDGEREEPAAAAAEGEGAAAVAATGSSHSRGGKGKGQHHHKGKQHLAAPPVAKLPIKKPAKPQQWYQQYATELTIVVVALITLLLAIMAVTNA